MQTDRAKLGAVTEVVLLFVVGLSLLVVLGSLVGPFLARLGLSALSAGEWAVIPAVTLPELLGLALPGWLFSRWLRPEQRTTGPGTSQPTPINLLAQLRFASGGMLLGGSLFYFLGVWLLPLYERLVPLSPTEQRALLRMLVPPSGLRPLWVDLLTFAACPAICEELFFRGAILGHLTKSQSEPADWGTPVPPMGTIISPVLFSSLLFGIIHLSWGRLVPTAVLGVTFALAVQRTGSLWTSVAMHATNNAAVVLLARRGLYSISSVPLTIKWAFLPLAIGALGLGFWLLRPAQPSRGRCGDA